MDDAWSRLRADLVDESAALTDVVAPLDAAALDAPTPAEGWTIRDQLSHLAGFDEAAVTAAVEPEAFLADLERRLTEGDDPIAGYTAQGRAMAPPAVRAWWQEARARLLEVLGGLDARQRVPWYGPPMSAMSHATARLMETWAHGVDVRDALGFEPVASARLRHVAHLGIGARPFAFANRGLELPEGPLDVVLTAPDGETWTWGPGDADDRVSGPALDFCLLVTQRRHRDDLSLEVRGVGAEAWVAIAQAFAGAPGPGRPRRAS